MTELLLQVGVSKLIFSLVLACGVWIVHRRVRRCAVSYPLWLMVLVALLAPAIVSIPVLPGAGPTSSATGAAGQIGVLLVAVWLLGTGGLLGWTLLRALLFQRALRVAARLAPPELQREAADLGKNLGLARIPEIHTTRARVSPMVWWAGGRVRVLVPRFLVEELTRDELRAILAHELAHARRRDHLVRWVEWLACSVFWWNPVAWWARRQLRIAEEWCCDALGVAALRSGPRGYARSLLRAIELMSESRTVRAPAFASAADCGGNPRILRRRLEMIMTGNHTGPAPRWLRTAIWIAVACVLPFGMLYCGSADQPDGAEAAEDADAAAPTPLAWSDEDFLNAQAEALADEMLAEIDLEAIRASHGTLAAYFEEGFSEMREELGAEVEAGEMSVATAEQFTGLTEELLDQLGSRVESRTLSEEEALSQFVYGMVRVLSVFFEMEDDRISDEEAGRRIEALRRELRARDQENREYASLEGQAPVIERFTPPVIRWIRDEDGKIVPIPPVIERPPLPVVRWIRDEDGKIVPILPVTVRQFPPVITRVCDEDGNCKSVESLLKRAKDPGHHAAAA